MNDLAKTHLKRIVSAFFVLLGLLLCTLFYLVSDSAVQNRVSAAQPGKPDQSQKSPVQANWNEAHVMGAKTCLKCHQDEYAQWMKTVHFKNPEMFLSRKKAHDYVNDLTEKAPEFAKQHHIAETRFASDSLCTKCHATTQVSDSGFVRAVAGVSCESCHAPSGGDPGWHNRHAVYGPAGTTRATETEQHRMARKAYCEQRGMIATDNLYAMAKNCMNCHIVPYETLVVEAGHPVESQKQFEFASWTGGEVRHNFHEARSSNPHAPPGRVENAEVSSLWLNPVGQDRNETRSAIHRKRLMYVTGLFAELETRLRMRANTQNVAFIGRFAGKIPAIQPKLMAIGTPETNEAALLLPPMLARLFVGQTTDQVYFNEQADKIAALASKFLDNHDGSKLASLDGLIPKPHYSQGYEK